MAVLNLSELFGRTEQISIITGTTAKRFSRKKPCEVLVIGERCFLSYEGTEAFVRLVDCLIAEGSAAQCAIVFNGGVEAEGEKNKPQASKKRKRREAQ